MKTIPLTMLSAMFACAQAPFFTPNATGVAPAGVSGRALQSGASILPQQNRPPATFDCAADGSVTNAVTGEPIVRAHIMISAGGSSYGASTDGSGKWSLENLGCAAAQLTVTRPGFLQNPSAGVGNTMRFFTLVSGSPARGLKTELTPQSVAYGKVQDDEGDPVTGVQVAAMVSRVIEGRARFQSAGTGMTNDLGEYRIANLGRGKYAICVRMNQAAAGQKTAAATTLADSCYPGPLEGGVANALDLAAGRETKVDFSLNQAPVVHVRGTITGLPQNRGIGVNLVRRGANGDRGESVAGTVREGKFDIRVHAGSYMLTADYFEGGKRLSARVPVEVGSSDVDNLVANLDAGFAVTGTVRVISQAGQMAPPPQFGMNLRPSEQANGTGQLKWEADHGSFTFTDVVPGTFRLEAFLSNQFYVKSATLAGQDILNSEIAISQAAGPIEVVLRDDGGVIEGDVVNAAGQPVAGGVIAMPSNGRPAIMRAPATGHFKIQNLPPGDYKVYAWDEAENVQYADPDWMRRFASGGTAVTVAAGQSQQVKLTEQMIPQ